MMATSVRRPTDGCRSTFTTWIILALSAIILNEMPLARANGSWSAWSEWSACSVSCGANGEQERTRMCQSLSNGLPTTFGVLPTDVSAAMKVTRTTSERTTAADGATVCAGVAEEKRQCVGLPACESPMAATAGEWSPWSDWTTCVRLCNNDAQERRLRHCLDKTLGCQGPTYESRRCIPAVTLSPEDNRPMIRLNRFVTGEGNFEALQGTSAVIHCCADNIAEPVRLKLFHKQMALENDTRTVVLSSASSTLEATITPLILNDTGPYSCFTRDNQDLATISTSILVLPKTNPEIMSTATVGGKTSSGGTTSPGGTSEGEGSVTNNSNTIILIIVPTAVSLVMLLLVAATICLVVRRKKKKASREQAVTSSNHIINQMDMMDNRKAAKVRPDNRPACVPYLGRNRQPLSLAGSRNSPYTSSVPAKLPNSITSPFSPKHDLNATFSHPLTPRSRKLSMTYSTTTTPTSPPKPTTGNGIAQSALTGLGHSTHRLNVYSPAEAEREYSKSCENGLEPSHLADGDESIFNPNITHSSLRPSATSDESLDDFMVTDAHLKKIKSKVDDDDELFHDITIACESRSIDLNTLIDDDGMDDPRTIVAAVSMELGRRKSSELLKSPLAKKISSRSTTSEPLRTIQVPLSFESGDGGFEMAPDYAMPSPKTKQCFEEFARASVPCLPTMDMCQSNIQSLPRTREHTDTLDRGEMVTGNDDTLKRCNGILSPHKDAPVTVL